MWELAPHNPLMGHSDIIIDIDFTKIARNTLQMIHFSSIIDIHIEANELAERWISIIELKWIICYLFQLILDYWFFLGNQFEGQLLIFTRRMRVIYRLLT